MKKKNISKKVLAILLSFIMIATSMPLMVGSAIAQGSYDPAPYWGDSQDDKYGALNTNFIATLNADGSVKVAFPHANAAATWDTYQAANPTKKTITNYVFTITKMEDDGTQTEIWSENFENKSGVMPGGGTFTIDTSAENSLPNSIYYWPGALTGLDTYEADASYDVSIQAVDSDGWVSDKIHTLLTTTPYYVINDDFSPNESWVARTMLEFEGSGSSKVNGNGQSSSGKDGSMYSEVTYSQSQIDFLYNANGLVDVNGTMDGMGYGGSKAYRFWFSGNATSAFNIETTWSRSHYNFAGAKEVWFYVDFTRVEIGKVAFTLSANEKTVEHFRDNTTKNERSHYGQTFSTVAAGGKNAGTTSEGIYIQNEDGLWESSSMTDGYFTNLSGYKGFVRIPIDYFILQADQYITGQKSLEEWYKDGCDSPAANTDNLNLYVSQESIGANDKVVYNGKTYTAEAYSGSASGYGIKINPAGTSVTDAIVVYGRRETYGNGDEVNTTLKYLAGDVTETAANDGSITYTVNDPINAIEDLVSAGIKVADWSADSYHKSFYIDQVMFCRNEEITSSDYNTSTGAVTNTAVGFPGENGDFANDYGYVVGTYYDRTVEVPKAVAQYIMQYFGEIPSLNDTTAKSMIDDIILEYCECFGIAKNSALSDAEKVSQAIEKLNTLGYTEAYNRYKAAEQFVDYIYSEDAESNSNAVIYFENTVEALPNPEFAEHTDVNLQDTLKQLMAIYETFNLSHYEMLGADTEAKFLELYDLVMGEEVKTGQSIGAYPFIPFNDFETNYTYGQYSDMYYDDTNRSSNKAADINNTGNFTTYVSDDVIDQPGEVGGTAIGWSPMDYRPSGDPTFGNASDFSKMDAQITDEGFADSLGATINLKGNLVCNPADNDWKIATLSTTYLGAEADTWGNLPGLDLSGIAVNTDSTNGTDAEDVTRYGEGVIPNSFVMYVDFTKVTNLNLNIKFILSDSSGTDVNCYFCGGKETDTPVIYLLDENGEWEAQKLKVTQTDIEAASTLVRDVDTGLCTIAPSELNKLQGYKGFIRIPLSNFRIPTYSGLANINVNYAILDNIIDDGYTIKQAKISVWDEAGNNEGSSVVIDSLGFTYDPACTNRKGNNTDCNGELNQDNGIYVKNMDEYFGVKTVDSSNFEKMVSTIDPYATEQEFKASFDACISAYIALSDYQKTIPEVKYCYETLLEAKYRALYRDYTNEIKKEQWKPLYTATTDDSGNVTATAAENLLAALATVSEDAKQYSTTDETLLDLYNTNKDGYLSELGFNSLEEAQAVIDMYELGYHRLSMDDRDSVSDADLLLLTNAYNAARRAVLIDGIIGDVDTFKDNIINIYGTSTHTDDDADRIPDTEDTDNELRTVQYDKTITVKDENNNDVTVNALGYYISEYEDISIFGKMLLNDDTDTAALYMNMYAAAEAVYDNSTEIKPFAGNSVEGGIVTYEARMKEAYKDVKAKIEARTVLNSTTLNEIEYCLGQYEAFKPRYAQVDELNYAYVELALLLPTADLATTDTVSLTNSDTAPLYSDAANADLTYVAARLNRTVSIYVVTDYKWTQTVGTTYNFGYFSVNGATGTETTYTKLGDYANGATAALAPTVSVDEAKAKKVPTGNTYEGSVTLVAFDSAQITDGVDLSTLEPVATVEVPVYFNSVNGSDPIFYTVEIPADMAVDWDQTTAEDVSYTIKNASLNGGTLTVGVADNTGNFNTTTNKGELRNGDNALAYTANNFGDTVFSENITTDTTPNPAPEVVIAQDDWDKAAVGEYRTTLTYTVVYDDGTT